MLRLLLNFLFLSLALTGNTSAGNQQLDGKPLKQRIIRDINPDPDIVEVRIVAREKNIRYLPGHGPSTSVYTYNGTIPGPRIEGKVGDTLIVHFYNRLPEPTTIHWHGLELPANMDGSNIAQLAVEPGGYFRYEFKLPRAALFWFHPHIRTNEQVERGLYGTLLVRDHEQDRVLGLPGKELVLALDDVLLDESGQIVKAFPDEPLARAKTQLDGRDGNYLLVNGQIKPYKFLKRGQPYRMRLVNTSNSRFMRVSIPGHRLWRIGGDGGLLESPIEILPVGLVPDTDDPENLISDPDSGKGLLLTPGERADVVFTPNGNLKDKIPLEWHDIVRGRHTPFYMPNGNIGIADDENDGKAPSKVLMNFILKGHKNNGIEYLPPSALRDIMPTDVTGVDKNMVMFGHTPPDAAGNVTFFAQMKDGMPLPFDLVMPGDAPTVGVGETRIYEIHNMTGGMHNFHHHGFHFQLLETQFVDMDNPENNYTVPAPYLEDKDTILIPARPGARMRSRSITRIAIRFDDAGREGMIAASGKVPTETESGGWLFHCHILEHSNRGMMSFTQVIVPGIL